MEQDIPAWIQILSIIGGVAIAILFFRFLLSLIGGGGPKVSEVFKDSDLSMEETTHLRRLQRMEGSRSERELRRELTKFRNQKREEEKKEKEQRTALMERQKKYILHGHQVEGEKQIYQSYPITIATYLVKGGIRIVWEVGEISEGMRLVGFRETGGFSSNPRNSSHNFIVDSNQRSGFTTDRPGSGTYYYTFFTTSEMDPGRETEFAESDPAIDLLLSGAKAFFADPSDYPAPIRFSEHIPEQTQSSTYQENDVKIVLEQEYSRRQKAFDWEKEMLNDLEQKLDNGEITRERYKDEKDEVRNVTTRWLEGTVDPVD